MRRFFTLGVCFLLVGTASAQTLYNNGSILTSSGNGFNGANVSQANTNVNSGGFTTSVSGATTFRLADDFTVPANGWNVSGISLNAYITSAAGTYAFPPVTPFTAINMNIWSGLPGSGTIVATSTTLGSNAWTGIYRTFNGTLVNDQRPVMDVQALFPNTLLTSGTYWFDVQLFGTAPNGSTIAFAPPVMVGGLAITGNAQQSNNGTWATISTGTVLQGVELAFTVSGAVAVPEPTTVALFGTIAVAGAGIWWKRRKAHHALMMASVK